MGDVVLVSLAFGFLIVLPGYAVSVLAKVRTGHMPLTATALGCALIPLAFLYASLLPIRLTRGALGGLGVIALGVVVVRWLHRPNGAREDEPSASHRWEILAMASLVVAVFALRLIPVWNAQVLPGVDGSQHTIITALFERNGGVPGDYRPYYPLDSFNYQFGAHSIGAGIGILTGIDPQRVLVVLEPLLMALIAAGTFAACRAFEFSRLQALVAGVIVGVVSPFPAWHVNWARLPLLLGTFVLAVIVATLPGQLRSRFRGGGTLVVGAMIAGLFLAHYRMVIALALFLSALGIWAFLSRHERSWRLRQLALSVAAPITVAALLSLPWVIHLAGRAGGLRPMGTPGRFFFSLTRLGPIGTEEIFLLTVALVLVGGFVSLRVGLKQSVVFTWWLVLMLGFSNPYLVPLAWSGYLDFSSVVSGPAVIPAGAVASYCFAPREGRSRDLSWSMQGLAVVIVVSGVVGTGNLLEPDYVFVHRSDLRAFEWIRRNTPPDAVFTSSMYVNTDGYVDTTDVGGWLAYFTERRHIVPPYLYLNESNDLDHYARLARLARLVPEMHEAETVDLVGAMGIDYLYAGPRTEFDVATLAESRSYDLVYQEGDTAIFEVLDE